jgi:hypothetical protein
VPFGEVTGKLTTGGTLEGYSMDPSGFRRTIGKTSTSEVSRRRSDIGLGWSVSR